MAQIFLRILNISISASYMVLAVLLVRLLLKKAPKWIAVVLWGVVAIRLIWPFSVESVFSLLPSAETISPDLLEDAASAGGLMLNDKYIFHFSGPREVASGTGIPLPPVGVPPTPDPIVSADFLQKWAPVFAAIWIIGMAAMLIYAVLSYAGVKRRVAAAVRCTENIYHSENVRSPFVLGLIRPIIYLPFHMNEQDAAHVVAHERAHVARKDHLWKPLGYLLLTVHWFNPFLWLGYALLCCDIELACDEKVIKALDRDARADYAEALISCSVGGQMMAACPVAFGEVGIQKRVESVLGYKKPGFWLAAVAVMVCVALSVCFLTEPKREDRDTDIDTELILQLQESYPQYFGLDASKGLDIYVWQMSKGSYSFGLLPHSETGRDYLSEEVWNLTGVHEKQMRAILATYDINEEDIYIIPWQHHYSSYIPDPWIITEGVTPEAKMEAYIDRIRDMLFGS